MPLKSTFVHLQYIKSGSRIILAEIFFCSILSRPFKMCKRELLFCCMCIRATCTRQKRHLALCLTFMLLIAPTVLLNKAYFVAHGLILCSPYCIPAPLSIPSPCVAVALSPGWSHTCVPRTSPPYTAGTYAAWMRHGEGALLNLISQAGSH